MTVDNSVRIEAEVTEATVVVVGPGPSGDDVPGVRQISAVELAALLEASPPPIQPGQLWLFVAGSAGALGAIRGQIEQHGATVGEAEHELAAWAAIARHLTDDAALQRATQIELRRENTALRRELNRALSALDHRHPILGLLPSPIIDDLAANRQPRSPAASSDGPAFLVSPDQLTRHLDRANHEISELREELDAIGRTKVMRWSRFPRRVYRRVRRL